MRHVSKVPTAVQPKPVAGKPIDERSTSPVVKLSTADMTQVVGGADLPSHGLDWRKKGVATRTMP